ncbi:MAG: dual specificity protein phosphatase [Marmoricola sp.]|jgi:dual specificity phosphatase 3|nr:dual specificity protein phosphatase [Marmoricola sp.]
MDFHPPPALACANASFVTPRLLVGGDLDTQDVDLAAEQLRELVEVGVTHLLDARIEWSDEEWVAEKAPSIAYLHHGMDDAGQEVPTEWFEVGVAWALEALDAGGTVLTHCHMGINRGPSLGFAVLLAQGWDMLAALDAIRTARPIAWVAYAEDALRWHHEREQTPPGALDRDRRRLARWREENHLDLATVIRLRRSQGY